MNIRNNARRWLSAKQEPPAHTIQDYVREEQEASRIAPATPMPSMKLPDPEYLALVREAWEQWQASINYFQSVSDPELVDYAIYELEASRRRYVYMLRQAEGMAAQS